MTEDALKSTRNLHRLILAVSLVTLIFALSLKIEETKQIHKAAVDALLQTNFLAYETWLSAKLQPVIAESLGPRTVRVEAALKELLVFKLDEILRVLNNPVHVGKLLTDDTVLTDLAEATLAQLENLNAFSLERDVQIAVPDVEPLVPKILSFFDAHETTGRRIEEADVTTVASDLTVTSFVNLDRLTADLSFKLVDSVRVAGSPTFQGSFDAIMRDVPGTSFLSWLAEADLGSHIEIADGQVIFAPALSDAPNGTRQEKLGTLSQRLAQDIASAGPEERTATILGTQVPGLLVVLAAPLTLMALTFYFVNHSAHVSRLAEQHADEIRDFAWLPITMTDWRIPGLARSIPGHRVELLVSAALLPLAALVALYFKLRAFGDVNEPTTLLLLVASLWIAYFWWIVQRKVDRIRELLAVETH